MIIEYNNKNRAVSPVAIDVWRIEGPIAALGTITDSNGNVNGHGTDPYHYIDITQQGKDIVQNIRASMRIRFFTSTGHSPITSYKPEMVESMQSLGGLKVHHVEDLGLSLIHI